jgi:hypothetical protein
MFSSLNFLWGFKYIYTTRTLVISNHVQDNVSNVSNVHLKALKIIDLEVDHPNFWGHKSLQ